ncbi:serine/threonine-protein kinase PknD [Mycobacterium vicinigordonae]|uniref:serine/threonine-protein kinase PknD n=1 Tax=Mycobacterium vicinigordonae TaxID=1719132 RepID=UPI001FEA3A81|nr:serine/threonine-protein kinase PknD [Mycobacterium vicinigordonae]
MEGTSFGKYRLIELLGRGGMGEVWRAFDTATDRVVALKILPSEISNDEVFQQRFRREAHSAARLSNPHLIPIHTYGEIDGRLFVDMQLIHGRDLQAELNNGPLKPERAVSIIDQVAKALHAAHRGGLLHRDVKPSNILLDTDDFAYLFDFGIARATDDLALTAAGDFVGTWHYMAPERFSTSPIDSRSDIYALSCVLYECLTAQHPFPGNTLERQITGHLTSPPPRPSTTNPGLPPGLDTVIAKGMAKHPGDRYDTAVDLARAARNALTTPPTAPQEPPTLMRPAIPEHVHYGARLGNRPPIPMPQAPSRQTGPLHTGSPQSGPQHTAPHSTGPQQTAPHPTGPQQTAPHPTGPQQTAPHPTGPQQTAPHPTGPQQTAPHPTGPQQTAPHPTGPQQTAPHPTGPQHTSPQHVHGPRTVARPLPTPPPTPAREPTPPRAAPPRPSQPWWRRKPVAISAVAVIAVAAAVVGVVVLGKSDSGRDEFQQVTLPFTGLRDPQGLSVDYGGTVYVADTQHNRILALHPGSKTPDVLPFEGLSFPTGVTADPVGSIYVNDAGNKRVLLLRTGATAPITLPFTDLSNPTGLTVDISHTVYVTDTARNRVVALADGSSTQTEVPFTGLNGPTGLVVSGDGTIYVSDGGNNRILMLPTTTKKQVPVPFKGLKQPGGVTLDNQGAVYVTDCGNNRALKLPVGSSEQIELPFTGLNYPWGLSVDNRGNIYVGGRNDQIVELQRK